MRKGSDVIGKAIIAYDTGRRVERVLDLLFDQTSNQVLSLLVDEGGLFHSARIILWQNVQAIGPNAIVVPSHNVAISANEVPEVQQLLKRNVVLRGTRILTTDGRDLGAITDMYFDEQTGNLEGYETSGGLFADAYSGRSFIPVVQAVNIGRDVAFVPPETANLMEEQVGGIRGAVQTASSRLQESTELANQRLQEAAQAANDRLQQTVEITSRQVQAAAEAASTQWQETSRLADDRFEQSKQSVVGSLTDALVSPEEQMTYVVGKTVDRDILTPDGMILLVKDQIVTLSRAEEAQRLGVLDQVYRATKGSLTVEVSRRLQENARLASVQLQAASRVLNQARGRRTQHMVRDDEGRIVAAPGQIVTDSVIERATTQQREAALLDAVGLSSGAAIQAPTQSSLSEVSLRLQERAAIAQENANTLWQTVKQRVRELQGQGARAMEERRIEQALGRPATRVILDPEDRVILNVGELITHRAIRQAQDSGVLNILLSSVYIKEPTISETELRAAEPGMAALEREGDRIV